MEIQFTNRLNRSTSPDLWKIIVTVVRASRRVISKVSTYWYVWGEGRGGGGGDREERRGEERRGEERRCHSNQVNLPKTRADIR